MGDGSTLDFFNFYAACFILLPFALFTLDRGLKALRQYLWLKRNADGVRAGLILGLFVTLVAFPGLVWTWESAAAKKHTAPRECMTNLRIIGLGMAQYIQDYDNTMPPTKTWADAVKPYASHASFHCPISPTPYGYAFNTQLSARDIRKVSDPTSTVEVFETDINSPNAAGFARDVVPNRHFWSKYGDNSESNYAFADGHVRMLRPSERGKLKWTP